MITKHFLDYHFKESDLLIKVQYGINGEHFRSVDYKLGNYYLRLNRKYKRVHKKTQSNSLASILKALS